MLDLTVQIETTKPAVCCGRPLAVARCFGERCRRHSLGCKVGSLSRRELKLPSTGQLQTVRNHFVPDDEEPFFLPSLSWLSFPRGRAVNLVSGFSSEPLATHSSAYRVLHRAGDTAGRLSPWDTLFDVPYAGLQRLWLRC